MHSIEAIAAFFEKGGQVEKLQGTIPVTAPEVLEYLRCRGIRANYSPGHPRLFLCKGKLVTLGELVEVANGHRSTHQLPPFVLRARV